MKISQTPKITLIEAHKFIEEARNAEFCRDLFAMQDILHNFWQDFTTNPDFAAYPLPVRGEMLRLCGFYLTFYGRSYGLDDYQLRAKDLLTKAIDSFTEAGLSDKVAESNILLAFCYWNSGENRESEDILKVVEAKFKENFRHPVYLQLQINRLIIATLENDFPKAFKFLEKIEKLIPYSQDYRLNTFFNVEAGILKRKNRLYDEAEAHFAEVNRLAIKYGNRQFVGTNLNNLAMLLKDKKDYPAAHRAVADSLEILNELDQKGWIAHVLDTRALIYIAQDDYQNALTSIDESLQIFRQGEDYQGLTAALWTKCRCLFSTDKIEEGYLTFLELQSIAREKIGEKTVKRYARLLAEKTHPLNHESLNDELAALEKRLIKDALVKSQGKIIEAAHLLGFEKHQGLSWKLNNKYPEIYHELEIPQKGKVVKAKIYNPRQRSGAKKPDIEQAGNEKVFRLKTSDIKREKVITRLMTAAQNYSFDFDFAGEWVDTYYFDAHIMQQFGFPSGAAVAVVPMPEVVPGLYALVSEKDKFRIGKIQFDQFSRVNYIIDIDGEWIPVDESNIIGEPIGYSMVPKDYQHLIEFKKLTLD